MIAVCVYLRMFRRWKRRALHSTRIMQWKERLNVETSQTGEKRRLFFVKIGEWLRFACVWDCFDAGKRVLQVYRNEASVYKAKTLKRERNNAYFSSKSANDCGLRLSGIVATLENAFYKCIGVRRAFIRRILSNGRESTQYFRQNRGMIAICVCLGLLRCWKTRVPRRACKDEWKERLNVEISQTSEK